MNVKSKGVKIVAVILSLVVFIFAVIIFLATRDVAYNKDASVPLQDTLIKVIKSCVNEKEAEITQCELNSFIESLVLNYDVDKHTKINGVYIDLIGDNNLNIYVPLSYRGINLVLNSNAHISVKDDRLEIAINNLKLGKLPVPSYVITNILSCAFSDKISISKNVIYCSLKVPINVFDNIMTLKISKLYINNNGNLILKFDGAKDIASEYIKKSISGARAKIIG